MLRHVIRACIQADTVQHCNAYHDIVVTHNEPSEANTVCFSLEQASDGVKEKKKELQHLGFPRGPPPQY